MALSDCQVRLDWEFNLIPKYNPIEKECLIHYTLSKGVLEMKVRLAIWAFTVLLVAACTEPIKEPGDIEGIGKIVPQPIPPRFDFPAARSTVQAWADGYEVERIRTHAWNIWAGMTADSASSHDGQLLPIWETWCGDEEVFSQTCGQADKPFRKFERPVQHAHLAKKKG